jgi:hypothetical protein
MGTLGRVACSCVLVTAMGLALGESSKRAEDRRPQILVEARIVQISGTLWSKLGVPNDPALSTEVTIPLAPLLYALGEPNAVRTVAAAKAQARFGQTEVVSTGEPMKYLLRTPGGALEPGTTETPVGTSLTVLPLALSEGRILLRMEFTHSSAERPREVDPNSSLPIGLPIISRYKHATTAQLLAGQPMIVGGVQGDSISRTYALICASVIAD